VNGARDRLVVFRADGDVATITLNRPERHNSLVPEMLEDLLDALAACRADERSGVLVLRAAGPSFSTGGDLRGFLEHAADIASYADCLVDLLNRAIVAIFDSRVPVIVVIDGQVTGGALGLVLAADVVLVSERASFTPYYTAVGFSPDGGWAALLPGVIGRSRAAAVQLLNQTVTAEQALDWGLATAFADSDDLEAAVRELGAAILAGEPGSLRCTRRLLRPPDLEERLDAERRQFVSRIASDEAIAGIRAFLGND